MPLLEVKQIEKAFGAVRVLDGVSFTQEEGTVLSIIGPSGSGKTTLLRCITGLEQADRGRIQVGDTVLFDADRERKLSSQERREKQLCTGMVFQSFHLFPQYTVLGNVMLARRLSLRREIKGRAQRNEALETLKAEAVATIESVGLEDKLDSYPWELSGGQQQRVAIARALMLSPRLLCFDEPTSALDPQTTAEVLKVMAGLARQGRTMIVVTHEMGFAREVSDQVLFMDGGRIAAAGTPGEIFDDPASDALRSFLRAMPKR